MVPPSARRVTVQVVIDLVRHGAFKGCAEIPGRHVAVSSIAHRVGEHTIGVAETIDLTRQCERLFAAKDDTQNPGQDYAVPIIIEPLDRLIERNVAYRAQILPGLLDKCYTGHRVDGSEVALLRCDRRVVHNARGVGGAEVDRQHPVYWRPPGLEGWVGGAR